MTPRPNPWDTDASFVVIHGRRLQWVAWHRGGSNTLAIGKRHLREPGSGETLCSTRVGRPSTRVSPANGGGPPGQGGYWHTGDCALCLRASSSFVPERAVSA